MKQKQTRNEDGLVAIVVATIVMIILSLVTLGFARLMQGEQKQALDRSLSTQAFYAAESAINDVVSRVQDTATPYTLDKTSCDQGSTPFSGAVNDSIGARYSCLLIDQAPESLEYTQGAIGTNSSKIIPVKSDTNANIGHIKLAWEESSASATSTAPTFTACPSAPIALPPFSGAGAWSGRTGMLRVDVIPADTLNRQALIDGTLSLYLYPCAGGGSVTSILYSSHNDQNEKGQIVPVRCTAGASPRDCEVSIDMDSSPNKLYYMRVKSIYKASDMTVRIYDTAPAANQMAIKGAQIQIDATGKVNDVIRRIQVRVPVIKAYPIPEFVLQTTDSICKQIAVAPGIVDNTTCGL